MVLKTQESRLIHELETACPIFTSVLSSFLSSVLERHGRDRLENTDGVVKSNGPAIERGSHNMCSRPINIIIIIIMKSYTKYKYTDKCKQNHRNGNERKI